MGLRYDGCQKYPKYSSVKKLRHRLKKRSDFFRISIEVHYKSHLMKSDV